MRLNLPWPLLLISFVIFSVPLRADLFFTFDKFGDVTATVSGTPADMARQNLFCGSGYCNGSDRGPAGTYWFDDATLWLTPFAEPGSSNAVGRLRVLPDGFQPEELADIFFTAGPLGPCAGFLGGCLTVDGSMQNIGAIRWSNGAVDRVFVQEVPLLTPEPQSVLLLLPVATAVVVLRHRRAARIAKN